MAAEVLDLTDYRKSKRGKRKLRSARKAGTAEVIDFTHEARKRDAGKHVDSFKGRGFPEDYNPGPDEPSEGFVPAINKSWVLKFFSDEEDK
jgi:hypothetical protein